MDLAASAADAAEYFKDQKGPEVEKLFWSQFLAPEHPALLNNHMKQLSELHRMSGLAMKDLIVRLWPAKPIPSSYLMTHKYRGSIVARFDK